MKRSYLWFGLAVPALGGGVLAFLKNKKNPFNGNGKKETESSSRVSKSSSMKETENKAAMKSPGSKSLSQPAERNKKKKESKQAHSDMGNSSAGGKKYLTGAKGGKYYLNEKGQKVYIKK